MIPMIETKTPVTVVAIMKIGKPNVLLIVSDLVRLALLKFRMTPNKMIEIPIKMINTKIMIKNFVNLELFGALLAIFFYSLLLKN